MLVNYDKNEVGTTAPELWALNFDKTKSWTFEDIRSQALPVPVKAIELENGERWSEASFAGPAHDVVVCEFNDAIRFYKISCAGLAAEERSFSLKVLEVGMPALDFGRFFHPIFTWGDTVAYPLMVATDHDGKGDVCVWKAPPRDVGESVPAMIQTAAITDS